MTHITYKTAKALKEFLGESAPEPMDLGYWVTHKYKDILDKRKNCSYSWVCGKGQVAKWHTDVSPAYQLHDLLSKPFCEAFAKHHPHKEDMGPLEEVAWEIAVMITELFYSGGLPAVEKALEEMMK